MSNILLLIKGLGRGGAEQLLVNAAPYLDMKEFDYRVAYLIRHKDALVPAIESAGLPTVCLDGARGVSWLGRLRALVHKWSIDLVHVHSPYAAVGARIASGKKVRIVYTEHNVWSRYRRATYWANALTYFRNDHVFAVSNQVRDSVRYPAIGAFLPKPPVETLYHGPDPTAMARWGSSSGVRAELGIPAGAPVVGTVANFKAHKGHEHLLRAALRVREAQPDVRFVLVGQGPLEERIRDDAHGMGLGETVVFAGYRTDAPRLIASFDVFALSSLQEGLSIALLEAMALGRPVVVTEAGGLPEAVEHNRHGMVVTPGDSDSLGDAIVSVLGDRQLARRLGESARRRSQDFDIRSTVGRTEEVYREILA